MPNGATVLQAETRGDVFAGSGGSGGDATGGPGAPGGDATFNCGGGDESADCFEAGG